MGIFVALLSFLLPMTSPVMAAAPVAPAVAPVEVQALRSGLAVPAPSSPGCPNDAVTKDVLIRLWEEGQGTIQPVLITNGKRTREMKKVFANFKSGLCKEVGALLREPKVITLDREMTVLGGGHFPDGINPIAIRNKLQMFDENIKLVVYADFPFSPFNRREPTGVYFRSQFDTLKPSDIGSHYRQLESQFLMWVAYTNL